VLSIFFYSFHLKHFFYFFCPGGFKKKKGERRKKKKLIKQSPNALHLAVSLWMLIVTLAVTGWGLLIGRSGRDWENGRGDLGACLVSPLPSVPALLLL
jgi:hypothetical protein